MRIPSFMLDQRVPIAPLTATGIRGATVGEFVPVPAVVDERAVLRVDQRADSDTFGAEITMTVQVITQLDRYAAPGSRVQWQGRVLEVANAARHSHTRGPSSAEMWCVG